MQLQWFSSSQMGAQCPYCYLIYRDGRNLHIFISFPEFGAIPLFSFLTTVRAQFLCFYTFSEGAQIPCFFTFSEEGGSSGVFFLLEGAQFPCFPLLYRRGGTVCEYCFRFKRERNFSVTTSFRLFLLFLPFFLIPLSAPPPLNRTY